MAWTSSEVVYYIVRPIFCVLLGFVLGWIYERFFKKPAPCITCQVRELLNDEVPMNEMPQNIAPANGIPENGEIGNRVNESDNGNVQS
uniref:Uncharacterized protein n=1 Tax=Acrobeloides nanus TaxID=290746 RepID=A0A914DAL9_9BILA